MVTVSYADLLNLIDQGAMFLATLVADDTYEVTWE